ncbi:MAG: SH3 domain-containing protein [Anaerolineae bacterium]|nr:SH3 domain-containing protein [Anaerolineae bacterium]
MVGQKATLALILLSIILVFAPQQRGMLQGESCPALVEQALKDLGSNCGNMARDTACYGFNRVGAIFTEDVSEDFFTQPSDRADLINTQSIQTTPLDTVLQEWGIALLSLRANIPNTLPGQSVRFILLGDASIENEVPTEEVIQQSVDPINITTLSGANIRSAPTTRANVIGSVPAGTTLQTDALSTDGEWLRVGFDSTLGWVNRALIQAEGDLSSLPDASQEPRSPMQAFTFRTGVSQLTCEEAPSLVVAQGPQNIEVAITVNGADINIGSTIVLQTTENNALRMSTINGTANANGVQVPRGFTVEAPLSNDGQSINGRFGGFRALTQDELDSLRILESLPDEVLNYPIDVPDRTVQSVNVDMPAAGLADCSGFRPTSPLDGLAYGFNTFFWDTAPGATSYRLTVIGFGSVETASTNVLFDLSNAGFNIQMSWYVEALVNGQTACVSPTVTVPREAAPPPFMANWSCGPDYGQITVVYENAPPGSTSVTFESSSLETTLTNGVPPLSGSWVVYGYDATGGSVTAYPSGQSIGLPPISCSD